MMFVFQCELIKNLDLVTLCVVRDDYIKDQVSNGDMKPKTTELHYIKNFDRYLLELLDKPIYTLDKSILEKEIRRLRTSPERTVGDGTRIWLCSCGRYRPFSTTPENGPITA